MGDYLKTIKLIEKKFFKKYIFINFLISLGSIFELLSIGLIIPLFYFLQNIENNIFKINDFFGYDLIQDSFNRTNLILLIILLFLLIYLIKSIYLVFLYIYTKRFGINHEEFLAQNVYSNYVYSDFIESTHKDKSKTFRNIHEVAAHTSCLQAAFVINQEILTFFFIFLSIFFIDPKIGLILSLASVFIVLFFYFSTKKRLKFLGEKKREIESQNFTNVLDALGSLKEIKIFQKENFFVTEFRKLKIIILNNNFKSEFYSFYPRFIIEFLVLSAFVIYFVFMYVDLKDLDSVIPKIIFLIMAVFRILPGINRIITNSQNLRKNSASIINIHKEKVKSKTIKLFIKDKNFVFNDSLKFNKVNFNYDNGKKVFKDINLKINKGEIVGIFGPSGSGKTTFINLCLGLIKPTDGEIIIDNKFDLFENSFLWHKILGFVPQRIFMKNDNITKNIAFAVENELIDEKKINNLIKLCNLNTLVENKEKGDHIFIGDDAAKISGGQAQRIGIARGLYKNPDFLILDEATNNLDQKNEEEIMFRIKNFLKKEKKTAIISSHNLEILKKNCDYILSFEDQTITKF